ncbi:hypothetical protein [Streptomyces olivaceoviridis]|uniref:hypothetical protein n=1 Tax=Streptomyces olivaceoviridis TaxID=1921 RepID=UPI003328D3FD
MLIVMGGLPGTGETRPTARFGAVRPPGGGCRPGACPARRSARRVGTVARALWDGWEDGAVAGSAGAPAWSAPGAVHPVRHEGPRFDVDLVPALPRSALGSPRDLPGR